MHRLTARLAGALVAAALIAVGIWLAARPVSDQGLRAHVTDSSTGAIVATRHTWDGSQVLTVAWPDPAEQVVRTQLEDYGASSPWQVGQRVDVLFDIHNPTTVAVLAHPSWTFAVDLRADAVFQAVVPFTLAGMVLALAVFWPAGRWLFGDRARRARRSLQRYILTPAVICALVVAGAVVYQDQPLSAYSMGADRIVGWLSVVLMLLLIWPFVRAVQYYRLRQLLTVPDDAVESAAITSITGRRLQIGAVQVTALAGQHPGQFQVAGRVRLYGRWERRGPALITDGEKLLIGVAKRVASAPQDGTAPGALADQPDALSDVVSEPIVRQYPQLARQPLRYVISAVALLLIVVVGSITIGATAGKAALGPLWVAWLLCALVMALLVGRYRQLYRLLHEPHVKRNGVVTRVATSSRGSSVPHIANSVGRTVRLRLIGERQASWLAEGREVVLLKLPTVSASAVVVATGDGHAALAIATVVQVQESALVGPSK